jgi:hypothetical protein
LKIDTIHFYNTLASSVPGIGNEFVKSVNWTEEKISFLVAILNENPEFYLDEIIDAYFKPRAWGRVGHEVVTSNCSLIGSHSRSFLFGETLKRENLAVLSF